MNIVEFAEGFLGCKLLEYQKTMLREFDKKGKRRSRMANCNSCFHKEVCESRKYVEEHWVNCPSYIESALVTVSMTDAQFKEATDYLNRMCEDLLAMRKAMENLDTTIELYHRIMNYRNPGKKGVEYDE